MTFASRPVRSLLLSSWLGLRVVVVASAVLVPVAIATPAEAQVQGQAQAKIAVIDSQRAVFETEDGLRVQATLKKLFDAKQVTLDEKQRTVLAEQEQLEKDAQNTKANRDTIQRKAENLRKQYAEIQQTLVEYQRDMQKKQTELTNPIVLRINAIVRRVASQEGYEMVIERGAAPYFRADLELTDKVIQLYNGGEGATAKPAPKKKAAPKPVGAGAGPKSSKK